MRTPLPPNVLLINTGVYGNLVCVVGTRVSKISSKIETRHSE